MGYAVLDDDGSLLWEANNPDLAPDHADMVTAADITDDPGDEILMAECHKNGAAHCYTSTGKQLWKNNQNCDHTECIWVGDFIATRPGKELFKTRDVLY